MAYYGRRVTAGDTDMGTSGFSGSNQRGQIFAAMPEHGWAYAMGGWFGKPSSGDPNVVLRFGLWNISGSTIGSRRAYSNQATVTAVMTFGGNGADINATLVANTQLWQGTKYGLGFAQVSGAVNWAMNQAANNPSGVADYYFHKRGAVSNTPTDPFSASAVTYEGAKDLYVIYDPNVKPTVTTVGAAPAGTITTATPTFVGAHADANSARGDKLNQSHIQVRAVGSLTNVWDSVASATNTEQTNSQVSRAYGGSALTPGTPYEWRYRTSDLFGAWADWSSWIPFTVNGGGTFTVTAGVPTGKQETRTPASFTGVWSHASGLSTNAVRVRILQNGQEVMRSPDVAKTVAPGGTATITWAESAFSQLAWGGSYTYQLQGRDTASLWSSWSAERAFTVNAQPLTPSSMSPANNVASSSRPVLTAVATDPDDTTGTGLTVKASIYNATTGAVVGTEKTLTLSGGVWSYTVTAGDLPSFGNYYWTAYANDGTVSSPVSAPAYFTYAAGPVITVTAPTAGQTITTHTPTLQFSADVATQSWAVAIYERVGAVQGDLVYSAGATVATAAGVAVTHAVPSGYLHNNTQYRVYVTMTSTLAVPGTSAARDFQLVFPAPAGPQNLQASPVRIGNDVTASAVLVSWDTPSHSAMVFREAVVTRRREGQALAEAEILDRYTSVNDISYYDYHPVSGVNYVYAVMFTVLQGTDETESAWVEASASVRLDHVVISSVSRPEWHVGLRYGQPMRFTPSRTEVRLQPWGQRKAHAVRGEDYNRAMSGNYVLHDDIYSLGMNDLEMLQAMHEDGGTLCYRDQYGQKLFGTMSLSWELGERGQVAGVTVGLSENDYVEGLV